MGDYNLNGLNPRDFEHLVQSLSKKVIAAGTTPFGDGKDGGREATFNGMMCYPTKDDPWIGYLVIQCKFCKKPTYNSTIDGQWVIKELEKDLKKYSDKDRNLPVPEFYLFVTNITLTPVQDTGSKDQAIAKFKEYSSNLGFKGYDIWGYDELSRFIDDNQDIRRSYAGFITSGDVLTEMMNHLSGSHPDFMETMGVFLQKELIFEQSARLESASQEFDRRIPLSQVFVDLPVTPHREQTLRSRGLSTLTIINVLLKAGSYILRNNLDQSIISTNSEEKGYLPQPRIVIVGGPGQGKSTLGQYLCQLYRAAILKNVSNLKIDPSTKNAINLLEKQRLEDGSTLPTARRFPIKITLNQYATDLAEDPSLSILKYIRKLIIDLGSTECSIHDLKQWLKIYPWLIVFDGLDEVPTSSNRSQLLKQLENFRIDASALNADIQIVATTRPQNYTDELNIQLYSHLYLSPLSPTQALAYAERLVQTRCGQDKTRKDILLRKLDKACKTQATAKLMQSPLQVTIMTTLIERVGEPPSQRYSLFSQYFRTIYERETGREGPLSALLSSRMTDIKTIHYRTGLVLQTQSENAGMTEAQLSDEKFRDLVDARLSEVGLEENEKSKLLIKITDGSLQRLVFLVRPKAKHVAFEIRSLQEFMAAEALMKGKEVAVISRLKTIAPISHWRNVFLFAAGKIFSNDEHLCEYIYFICQELNERIVDPVAEIILWGSHLALDITTEAISKPHPKFDRLLTKISLDLIDLPDYPTIIKLANTCHKGVEDLFQKAIEVRLKTEKINDQIGAWLLLLAITSQNLPWALKIVEEKWPKDPKDQAQILLFEPDYTNQPWMLEPLVNIVPYCTPFELKKIKWPINVDRSNLPTWFESAKNVLTSNQSFQKILNISCQLDDSKPEPSSYRLVSIFSSNRIINRLKNMPFQNPSWAPFISAARFSENPSNISLAKELKWLADNWNLEETRFILYDVAWPLAACLSAVDTKNDLLDFSKKAEDYLLGSIQEWIAAEKRWESVGIDENDILSMTDDFWPFCKNIDSEGFPFEGCRLVSHPSSDISAECRYIIAQYKRTKSQKLKHWLAHSIVSLLNSGNHFKEKLSISATDLKNILTTSIERWSSFDLSILNNISIQAQLNEEWVQFFNWLGGLKKINYHLANIKFEQTEQLASWYNSQPNKFPNIIKILGLLVYGGNKVSIVKNDLTFDQCEDNVTQICSLLLCFSYEDNDLGKLKESVQKIELDPIMFLNNLQVFINMFNNLQFSIENVTNFLLAIHEKYSTVISDQPDTKQFITNTLVTAMNGRKSKLVNGDVWQELELPIVS